MATNITNFLDTKVINQLGTYQFTATETADVVAKIAVQVNPPSGLAILIQKNGVTQSSVSSPAASQQVINLSASMSCVATDVVQFVLSSSSPIDQQQYPQNTLKAILDVHKGSKN